ncbi:MAG: STAS domain-containing protein [Chloroflexota bacterium]|nr:STAS domain-containing protein [Chloroflexota bacterium]
MSARQLEVRVRQQPRVAIVDLQGEINSFGEAALQQAYADAEAWQPEVILLNFEDVDYINSTGIALIVSMLAKARASHRRLLVCGLSEHYVELFQITRLADYMSIFPSEAEALEEVPSPTA